jgi:L-lactate utilization protein LutB
MCLTLPETLISVVGIDKVLPTFSDLEVFLQLLARSATGERMNPYTSVWSGVTPGDGPQEFHLVLLDNGRSGALADKVGRQALRCIRCAACLNVCPVYERVGGHAYGSVYPGPIGAVLTPQLHGVATDKVAASLPFASTLCGACFEVCPVRIDIPRLLVHLRARTVDEAQDRGPTLEGVTMAGAGVVLSSPRRLATAERLAGRLITPLFRRGKIGPVPGPLGRWTAARDAPVPAAQSFRDWWRAEHEPAAPVPPVQPNAATGAALGWGHLFRALLPRRSRSRRAAGSERRSSGRGPGPGRAGVLGAVKSALSTAPFHPPTIPRAYLGVGRSGVTDPLDLFVSRVSDYQATVHVVPAEADIAAAVGTALTARASRRVIVPADFPEAWLPPGDETSFERDGGELAPDQLEQLDATITGCAVAIAGTGTIVLDGGPTQGRRALSLLPDHLLVVVLSSQLVGGVPDAIARLRPSAPQTWISGPSATSDIELNRVEGVHGPRRLDVVVVGDNHRPGAGWPDMPVLAMTP